MHKYADHEIFTNKRIMQIFRARQLLTSRVLFITPFVINGALITYASLAGLYNEFQDFNTYCKEVDCKNLSNVIFRTEKNGE